MIRTSMKAMVAALGVAAMVGGASVAQAASNVVIDLDGVGGAAGQTISSIDLNAGNSVAIGGTNAPVGTNFDVYFQSTVSALNLSGGGVVSGIGSTYYLSTVVKFSEQKSFEVPGVGAFFQEGTGSGEYFELWLTTTPPNDLTGVGFGADNAGAIKLLSGSNIAISSGSFNIDSTAGIQNFDGTPDGNQYPGVTSVSGSGGTTVSSAIDFVNTDYIHGILSGDVIDLVLANPASNAVPFDAVNPSGQFWDANTSSYVATNIGTTNGLPTVLGGNGSDFQFQTNGNLTFGVTAAPVVPEPATAAMGLLALAGLAAASRRRRA